MLFVQQKKNQHWCGEEEDLIYHCHQMKGLQDFLNTGVCVQKV